MENIKVNFFKRIYKSTYDFSFYQLVEKESFGKAFVYLILFSLLISLVSMIGPISNFNNGINYIVEKLESDIPYFELSNGELYFEGEMPIISVDDEDNIFIIDTTNKTDPSILDDYKKGFYIDKNKLIYKENLIKKEVFEFNDIKEIQITKYDIQKFLPYLKFISIFIMIFIIIGVIIGKLFSSLFVSLIGLIVNSAVKSGLSYKDIYKLGIYSLTLPSIIKLMYKNITFPYSGYIFFFVYYGIVTFYLTKAMTRDS